MPRREGKNSHRFQARTRRRQRRFGAADDHQRRFAERIFGKASPIATRRAHATNRSRRNPQAELNRYMGGCRVAHSEHDESGGTRSRPLRSSPI